MIAAAVYILCMLTSLACSVLLFRAYARSRSTPFLLWTGLCFAGLALNNLLLFLDRVVLPNVDLSLMRMLTAFASIAVLVYGLVWEAE